MFYKILSPILIMIITNMPTAKHQGLLQEFDEIIHNNVTFENEKNIVKQF